MAFCIVLCLRITLGAQLLDRGEETRDDRRALCLRGRQEAFTVSLMNFDYTRSDRRRSAASVAQTSAYLVQFPRLARYLEG